jgi:hypothetical protein
MGHRKSFTQQSGQLPLSLIFYNSDEMQMYLCDDARIARFVVRVSESGLSVSRKTGEPSQMQYSAASAPKGHYPLSIYQPPRTG